MDGHLRSGSHFPGNEPSDRPFPASDWEIPLNRAIQTSQAFLVGVFNADGTLLFAKRGMSTFLKAGGGDPQTADCFTHPDFTVLNSLSGPADAPVFEGTITAGIDEDDLRSFKAVVYRRFDRLLVLGEYDALELGRINRELTGLTREVNRLQRQLLKEKKRLEETLSELKETQGMLVHSEKMNALGKLVAGIAHEVNNPIAFVASNLYSLKESFENLGEGFAELEAVLQSHTGGENETARIRSANDIDFILDDFPDLYRATQEGIDRVTKLVRDLRTFSRLDEGTFKEVDLTESVHSALNLAGPELKKRNITVDVDIEQTLKIGCYAAELNQVFLNLIVNAVQAMESTGGRLTIRGRKEANHVHLTFTDTGAGIPADVLPYIFDPFFTTKPVGGGTGLGLSLAYKIIVEKHHGEIFTESTPSQGSRFTIRLPLSPAQGTPPTDLRKAP